jgi:hypothetical protein
LGFDAKIANTLRTRVATLLAFSSATSRANRMRDFFTKHPASVGETYWQHMGMALSFAGSLFLAACAALLHALFPALCEKTASQIITRLHDRMVLNRCRQNPSKDEVFEAKMPENARQI